MNDMDYAIAYSQVLEILKYISTEDYKKIPKNKIEIFQSFADKNYIFNFNPNLSLDDQNVCKKTKVIIGILFRDYWANEIQKKKIIAKQTNDRNIIEKEKRKDFSVQDIFNKKDTSYVIKSQFSNTSCVSLKKKQENVFDKIFKYIKNFFSNIKKKTAI